MWLFRSSGSLHLLMVSVHHSLQEGKRVDQEWEKVLPFRVGPTNSSLYPQSGFMQMCLCGGGGLSEKEVQEVKLIQSWRQTGTVTVRQPENQFPFTLLHSWWECILKLVQPPWETEWRFLRKLKIELTHDPSILPLGIYPDIYMQIHN